MTASKVVEVVLPSGRFARVRSPTMGDIMGCFNMNPMIMVGLLACKLTVIDDIPLAFKELCDGEASEYGPLLLAVNKLLGEVSAFQYGAKQP